ncbi:MAG TPA: hypothetical protein VGE78_06805, partial [Agromyces sp.]
PAGEIVVIDDSYGALALGAAELAGSDATGPIRVHQDLITGERALAANADRLGRSGAVVSLPLGPGLVHGARLVVARLPRSLDRLDEVAALVAGHAASDAVLVAGGRIKHMSPAMNEVLGRYFARVDVSHARQKSRVLTASGLDTRAPSSLATRPPKGVPTRPRASPRRPGRARDRPTAPARCAP